MAITRVFIDSRVNDQDLLISQFTSGTEYSVLDAGRNGIEQMVSALAGQGVYDSIQIISHGGSGSLSLGSTVLDSSTLHLYAAELAQIGRALTENGDLLLYGCDVAAGDQGRQFIETLSQITGADVAASDDATGGTAAGGDWALEVQSGAVEQAASLHAPDYGYLLANNIPIVTGPLAAIFAEGDPAVSFNLLENAHDVDVTDLLSIGWVSYTVDGLPSALPAGITIEGTTLAFNPANPAYNAMAPGEQTTVVVNYQVLDSAATAAISFATKVDYVTGYNPFSVTSADVNGDGQPDLITANYGSDTVSVLKNNGTGVFAYKVDYATGISPSSVTSADVNGDSKLDLIVANFDSGTVSVLKNNGDGTFATKEDYATGLYSISVTSADVNGEGQRDLIAANAGIDKVSVLENNGDGTFATKVDYTTGDYPISVTSADVNGDGQLDLIVANYSSATLSVLKNNGDGTFASKVDYQTGLSPYSVTSADVNDDGQLDLIVANYRSATVSVLKNNGDGTFAAKVDYTTGSSPDAVTSVDVNGDGQLDLIVANSGSATVSVLKNNGDGTFATKVDYTTGSSPDAVTSADVNGDGQLDLIVANGESKTVSVLLNTSGGFTGYPTTTETITILGANDAPLVTNTAGAGLGSVTETGYLVEGSATTSGTLTASDVDTGATQTWSIADTTPVDTYGSIAINANSGVWTYTLGNTNAATQALFYGETVTQSYTARVTDEFGAFADQTITVTIQGTNDAPVVTNTAEAQQGAVTEAGYQVEGLAATSGTLTASDVDTGATQTWSIADPIPVSTYGSIAIDANTGVWTYALDNTKAETQALREGETVTQSYDALVTDEFGTSAGQTITVTIHGTNDAPVVTNTVEAQQGSVTEAGYLVEGSPTTSGTLTASDVNTGAAQTWSIADTAPVDTYGSIDINANSGVWTYMLDNTKAATQALYYGETVTQSYTARVTDDSGAFTDQTITVTIHGANDSIPTVSAPLATILAEGDLSVSLDLLANAHDDDLIDTLSVGTVSYTVNGAPSALPAGMTMDGSILTIDPANTAYEAMAQGEQTTIVATYQVLDGAAVAEISNNSTDFSAYPTTTETITIHGANDAPVVDAADVTGAVTDLITPIGYLTDSGTINFADVDLADSHSISSVSPSAGALGTLTPTITADTTGTGNGGVVTWNYSVEAAAVEYLAEGEHKVETFTFSLLDGHGGSVEQTVNVTITGSTDVQIVDLTGAVTFWKTGAPIAGVTSTLDTVPADPGAQGVEFRNIQIAADGTRTIEIWETSANDLNSLQLEFALPTGSIATWQDEASLPSGWSSLVNTGISGEFMLGGVGLSPLSAGIVKLGTLTLTAPANPQHFELALSKGDLGDNAIAPFGIASDRMITALDGLYQHFDMSDDSYALTSAKVSGTAEANAIKANDAFAVLKIAAGLNPNADGSEISSYQYLAADVNKDGQVRASDALNILKMAIKLDSAPEKEWLFVPESVASEEMSRTHVVWPDNPMPVSLHVDQDVHLIGIVMGDVNGSWVA